MKRHRKFFFGLSIAGSLLALAAVMTAPARAGGATEIPKSVLAFRDRLAGAAGMDASDPRLNDLVYLPVSGLLDSPKDARAPQDFLSRIADSLRGVSPLDLYDRGRSIPAHPRQDLDSRLQAVSDNPEERITIVVVPGVFGELIKTRAFEDIFAQPHSSYRVHWKMKLAEYTVRDQHPAWYTQSFELESMKSRIRLLDDMLSVSSIDGEDGRPLVNVILFNTPLMSLESMGDISERGRIFLERLEQFFEIMGTPKNLAFVGYSRGTMVGLEMLARANENPAAHPWLKNLRAMVSLGGVVYGSDLADDAVNASGKNPAPASFQQIALLEKLGNALQEVGSAGWFERRRIRARNDEAWLSFARDMLKVSIPSGGLKLDSLDFDNLAKAAEESFKPLVSLNVQSALGTYLAIGFQSFDLKHPFEDYDVNVLRMKKLTTELVTAVRQLSTPERLQWWRTHVVPTQGIRYYSITGTMADDRASAAEKDLASNSTTYNLQLFDEHYLQSGYHDFEKVDGMKINDSQVAAYKVRFWPELNSMLNPAQPAMDAAYLGVVGTHHWGLALRVVSEPDAKKVKDIYNPFPRAALMKAIAATIAEDQVLARKRR